MITDYESQGLKPYTESELIELGYTKSERMIINEMRRLEQVRVYEAKALKAVKAWKQKHNLI